MEEIKTWLLMIAASIGLDLLAFKSGMVGGLVSLTYEKKPTFVQAALAIIVGAITAGYVGPLVRHYLQLDNNLYGGVNFLLGLLAMRLTPGLFTLAERFASDPVKLIKQLIGKNGTRSNK
jgi:fructose-specific phosphotransferase system IIC component